MGSIPTWLTILNGSKKAGVAEQLKTQLSASFPELLLTTGNALKNNYTKSQLIVVNPAIDAATVAALLSSTNSEKSDIPKGEVTLDTDIIIIIGSE